MFCLSGTKHPILEWTLLLLSLAYSFHISVASDIVVKSLRHFNESTRDAVLSEIAQLSSEGHTLDIGLTYSYDASKKTSTASGSAAHAQIPFILHQQWRSRNVGTHSKMASDCQRLIRKYAPEFLHVLWTDSDIDKFVQEHYPELWPYYTGLDKKIKRTDYARYLILYKYGGLYMDLDMELKRPIAPLFGPIYPMNRLKRDKTAAIGGTKPNKTSSSSSSALPPPQLISYVVKYVEVPDEPFVANAFFAVVPKSPILKILLEYMVQWSDPHPNDVLERDIWNVLRHTGPIAFGTAVDTYLQSIGETRLNETALISAADIFSSLVLDMNNALSTATAASTTISSSPSFTNPSNSTTTVAESIATTQPTTITAAAAMAAAPITGAGAGVLGGVLKTGEEKKEDETGFSSPSYMLRLFDTSVIGHDTDTTRPRPLFVNHGRKHRWGGNNNK